MTRDDPEERETYEEEVEEVLERKIFRSVRGFQERSLTKKNQTYSRVDEGTKVNDSYVTTEGL